MTPLNKTLLGKTMSAVRVGQIWEDMDPRSVGKRYRQLKVKEFFSKGEKLIRYARLVDVRTGRETAVRASRMRPGRSGYKLLYDPDESGGVMDVRSVLGTVAQMLERHLESFVLSPPATTHIREVLCVLTTGKLPRKDPSSPSRVP